MSNYILLCLGLWTVFVNSESLKKLQSNSSSISVNERVEILLENNQTESTNVTLESNKVIQNLTMEFNHPTKGTEVSRENPQDKFQTRSCPYCVANDCNDKIAGTFFDLGALSKVFLALAMGTVIYIILLFAYKKWTYVDVPYHTSVYYGGSNSGKGGWTSNAYNKRRRTSYFNWPQEQSLLTSVWKAIENIY